MSDRAISAAAAPFSMANGVVSWRAVLADMGGFGIVRLANIVYPLATLPILAHALSAAALGLIILFTSLATWLAILIMYGFEATATRALVLSADEACAKEAETVWSAQLMVATLLLLLLLPGYFLVPFMHHNPFLLGLAWLSGVAQAIHARWFFRATQQISRMAVIEVTPRLVSLPVMVFVVWIWPDAIAVFAVMLTAHVVTAVWSVRTALGHLGRIRLSAAHAVPRLIEDFPVFLSFAGASLYSAANVIILGLFLPTAGVAFFGAAERLVRAASNLIAAVPQSLYPVMVKLYHADRGAAHRLVWASSGILFAVGAAGAVAAWLLGPFLVPFLLGDKYGPVVGLLGWLSLMLPFLALGNVFGSEGLLASGRNGAYAVVTAGAGALNVILAFVLVPLFGEWGMVGAVLATAVVMAASYCAAFNLTADKRTIAANV